MTGLSLRLFGEIQITQAEALVEVSSRKALALLAYLAVRRRPHSRDILAALLWPETGQARARASLRRLLWILNQSPVGAWLEATVDTIRLRSEGLTVDTTQFSQLLQAEPAEVPALSRAIELYGGDFLAGFHLYDNDEFETWAREQRESYRQQALGALDRLAAHQLRQGAFEAALSTARRHLAIDNLSEAAYCQLFLALAGSGRRTAALAEFEALRSLLDAELGVAPGQATRQLIEQIRAGQLEPAVTEAAARPRQPPPAPETGRPGRPAANPYRGLFSFREEDAPFFFGREGVAEQLVGRALRQPLVAVIGPSGCGKSSVVHAGLVAALRRQGDWLISALRPGGRPFQALAGALIGFLEPELGQTGRLVEAQKLAAALEKGETDLATVVERILAIDQSRRGDERRSRLLLVVDHFEELFILAPDTGLRQRFFDLLLEPVFEPQEREAPAFCLVFALRADFLGQALEYRPLAEALQGRDIKLGPMVRREMTRAIVNPAHLQGAAYEPGLVSRLLEEVGQEPGYLPLLEFALTALWEAQVDGRLTHQAYEEIGRVQGALSGHAEAVFEALSPEEQAIARRIFLQVVRLGDRTGDTRRLASRAELGDEAWRLVQRLAASRLLVTGRDPLGDETVEVVHEALIHGWARLQGWMEQDRTFRVWQERLRASMRQWQANDQDEEALLRGLALSTAEKWLGERPGDLSGPERDFIRQSLERRRQASRAQREVEARRLAGLARLANEESASRSTGLPLLLARQAVLTTLASDGYSLRDANNALRRSILTAPSQPRRRLAGHDNRVHSVAFSPDGARLVTASFDGTARVWQAQTGRMLLLLSGHTGPVKSARFNPDGTQIITASDDTTARIWDARTGRELRRLNGHANWLQEARFSPDGASVLTASIDGTARLWDADAASGQVRHVLSGHRDWVNAAAFSPDGSLILLASGDGTATLWDTCSGELRRTLKGHTGVLWAAEFSPDGRQIVTGSWDTTARIWDAESGQLLHTLEGHTSLLRVACFSPDGSMVVTAGEDGATALWDSTTGQRRSILKGHHSVIACCCFSPDGSLLLTASTDRSVRLWQTADGLLRHTFEGHEGPIWSARFSPDGSQIAAASWDGTATLWGVDERTSEPRLPGFPPHILARHRGVVNSARFSPDGCRVITAGDNALARVWDVQSGELLQTLAGHTSQVLLVQSSGDGSLILTASLDGTAKVWDARSGEALFSLETHGAQVRSAVFSPEGRRIVTASGDMTAKIWLAQTGQELVTLAGHTGQVRSAVFSPDGTRVVTASQDHTARVWEAGSGRELLRLSGHQGVLWSAGFSPDGTQLVTASQDYTARVWDAHSGELRHILAGHRGPVGHDVFYEVATFSPDGSLVLTASQDNTARVWEAATGRQLHILAGHQDEVWCATFSPDGAHIVTASGDGTLKVWDTDGGDEIYTLEGHGGQVWSGRFSPDGSLIVSASSDGTARLWQVRLAELLAQAEWLIPREEPAFTAQELRRLRLS